jgi:hypothetical protein
LGYAFTFSTWPDAPAINLSDAAFNLRRRGEDVTENGNIFAHELGHILLNSGDHIPNSEQLPGFIPGPNLMVERPNIAYELTESQCNEMRKNKKVVRAAFLPELNGLR